MIRFQVRKAFRFLPLIALACSSTVEPHSGITLLVTNGTCGAGSCSPLEILGFPDNQPGTPGGLWSIDLGLVTGSAACVTLPLSAKFLVIGGADTTTYLWTTARPLSLGAQSPSASRIFASPSTSSFVPAAAAGWRATLPGAAQVSASPLCATAL
jgi:hypothetical protein